MIGGSECNRDIHNTRDVILVESAHKDVIICQKVPICNLSRVPTDFFQLFKHILCELFSLYRKRSYHPVMRFDNYVAVMISLCTIVLDLSGYSLNTVNVVINSEHSWIFPLTKAIGEFPVSF